MQKVNNKVVDDQIPRGTDFADLEDFLGKSPDDVDQISPVSKDKASPSQFTPIEDEPESKEEKWVEDDANELLALDKDRDESMEFDDPDAEQDQEHVSVNIGNLTGSS